MVEESLWMRKVDAEPQHSTWFVQRFRDMAAAGKDILGEARLIDALAPRGARILDAGCGSGRVGGELARRGHRVVGVDVDPVLIAAAREDYPETTWLVGDLAELDPAALTGSTEADVPRPGAADSPRPGGVNGPRLGGGRFDVIVAAGNVMPFLAPSTRVDVLRLLRACIDPAGRFALGFGAGRGYAFDDFDADAAEAGWQITARFRGWNLLPFDADSDFLVAVAEPGLPRRMAGRSVSRGGDPMGGNSLRPMR